MSAEHHHILKPLNSLEEIRGKSVFLAGSLTPDWRSDLASSLFNRLPNEPLTVIDPRRKDWDDTWKESIHDLRFKEQVEWELDAQETASLIAIHFSPETRAPVSLLELGLNAHWGKVVVCCPDGYWRKGNVEVVCARYDIKLCETLKELEDELAKKLLA